MCTLCDRATTNQDASTAELKLSRRQLLAAGVSFGAIPIAASVPSPLLAQTGPNTAPDLGRVQSFVLRNAYVMSMDPGSGDLEPCDVHVVGDTIVAVEPNISADVDLVIDGSGKVVLPGFIDTHTHMWSAIWRNLDVAYLELTDKLGPHYRPQDAYNAVLLCALEMLNAGVTTVHAWEHNVRSPEHADAELQALKDAGIRAHYSYGYHHHLPSNEAADLADMVRARDRWSDDMITIGYASRVLDNDGVGPTGWPSATAAVRQREWAFARRENLPITHHVTYVTAAPEPYFEIAGPDVLLVHGYQWAEAVWRRLADAGVRMSMSPYTSAGYRTPIPFGEMAETGIVTSLSFDSLSSAGSTNGFREMLVAKLINQFAGGSVSYRDLLRAATLGGAAALGLDAKTGSLEPGKQADLMVVDLDAWNMGPSASVEKALVHAAEPAHVRHVAVAGKLVKFDGELTGANAQAASEAAGDSLAFLLERSPI